MEIHGFFFLFFLIFTLLLPSQSAAISPCASRTFSSNRVFSTCAALPHLSASLHWTLDPSTSLLSLAFAAPAPSDGWLAWAVNPTADGMIGSQTLIAFRGGHSGAVVVKTYNITSYGPVKEGPIGIDVSDLAGEYVGSEMRIFAKVKLARGTTKVNGVWQVGESVADGVPAKHAFAADNLAAKGVVDLVKGVSVGGGGGNSVLRKKNIHGVLNAVSWGILLPLGAIIARYLKTFKSADPAWFYLHVSCQLIGYAVGVAGWATGLNLGSKSKGIQYTTHRNIGITLFALGTVQLFALFLRPNKDHKYRLYWNIYHHSVGYTVIVLGVVNVFKGLQILQPLHKWKEAYIVVICILAGIAVLLEVVTWIIVLRRKSDKSSGAHDGANGANGRRGVQQPLSA
ncbi:putative cytochrome b561 and DOMON domain-containing protein [Iris pallida]|uniref:Cytochrome b561 and DOMON domain-containing protein n=1 Tax=Iris pallida TaxID=29817 RepID=A0AAX6EWI3_IRIPA|nr:putative cytochrome b561 and DOMON domain-containing protein [Iris pallida]